MVSRSTIAVALVAVALLAGCSGLIGDGGAESPEEFEYADGFSADGITDTDRAVESNRQALAATDSYTIDYTQDISGGESNVVYEVRYAVDVAGEQALHSVVFPNDDYEAEIYYGSDERVVREATGGDEQVGSSEHEFSVENLTASNTTRPLLANTTVYETSVEERDGTSVVVYETNGSESAAAVFGIDEEDAVEFSAAFSVDSDGMIRHADYDLTYLESDDEEQRVTLEYEVRDVDGTTVERPDWADDA